MTDADRGGRSRVGRRPVARCRGVRRRSGHRRVGRRLALAAAVVLGVIAGLAVPAFAHATLESTNPPSGGVVAASPGQVELHFDEQVAIQANSVEVFNSGSKRVDSGGTRHVPGDSHSVEVAVPKTLANGGYVVTWRVISADSHPVHGAFTFSVGRGGGADTTSEAARLLASGRGSRTVGVVFGLVRFLDFAAAALLLGGALFAVAIWPGAREDRSARRLLWAGFAALLATTAASFVLQGPYGDGLRLTQALRWSVLQGVWHTRFGHVYAARVVLVAAAGVVLAALLRRPADQPLPPATVAAGALIGVAILSTWGLADHASTGSWVPVALPFDVVHLGAASIWIGGLIMTVGAVVPASRGPGAGPDSPLRTAMPRFSQWALGSVVAIAVTGLFAAWRQIGISWGALTTTAYGRLVIYKVVGFAVLLALASISRSAVRGRSRIGSLRRPAAGPGPAGGRPPGAARPPRPVLSKGPGAVAAHAGPPMASRLRAAAGAEVVVALVVLGLTAVLVNAVPAKQAYAAPFSAEVKAGPDLLDIVVDPAKAGPIALHLYVLTPDGAQADVPEVTATMSDAAAGISGLTIPLSHAGPGHFLTNGFTVPIRGTWTILTTVRTDAIDEYQAQPVTVAIH